jgi:hypothetical protein
VWVYSECASDIWGCAEDAGPSVDPCESAEIRWTIAAGCSLQPAGLYLNKIWITSDINPGSVAFI